MSALILRFPDHRQVDLVLDQGVHAIGRDPEGLPGPVANAPAAIAQFCVDRRGAWLQLRDGAQGVHVNGRPVRRMAMLRGGDSVYLDGVELLLLGREPHAPHAPKASSTAGGDTHAVLRGLTGPNHGRCFGLDRSLALVRLPDGGLFVGQASEGEVRARLHPHDDGIVLQAVGDASCQVNGWPMREALLRSCDQLLVDAQHRFLIEAPMCAPADGRATRLPAEELQAFDEPPPDGGRHTVKASARRLPWLLLAALLLSAALSLLLLYGAR